MPMNLRRHIPSVWTPTQRRALWILSAALLLFLSIQYVLRPQYVADPQPREGGRFADLADKIDPNEADWPTLAALPTVGESRAKTIVEYREAAKRRDPAAVVFRYPSDLTRVRGVGLTTVQNLRPYLAFPGEQTKP